MKKLKVGDIITVTEGMEIKTMLPQKFFNKNTPFSEELKPTKIIVGEIYNQKNFSKGELYYEIVRRLSDIFVITRQDIEYLISLHPEALDIEALDTTYLAGDYIITNIKRIAIGHSYITATKKNDQDTIINILIDPN